MPSVYPQTYRGSARSLGAAVRALTASDFRSAAPRVISYANENFGVIAANENLAIASRVLSLSPALRALGGLLPRGLPLVGYGLLAYDLYRLANYLCDNYWPHQSVSGDTVQQGAWLYPSGSSSPYRDIDVVVRPAQPMTFQLNGWVRSFNQPLPEWADPGKLMSPVSGVWTASDAPLWHSPYDIPWWNPDGGASLSDIQNAQGSSYLLEAPLGNPFERVTRLFWYDPDLPWYAPRIFEDFRGSPSLSTLPELVQAQPASDPYVIPFQKAPQAPLIHTIDPSSVPGGYPATTPTPIPFRLLPLLSQNPFRAPELQRNAGYDQPGYESLPSLRPNELPYSVPSFGISTSPLAARRASPLTASHVLHRPPPGSRERKFRTRGQAAVAFTVNTVTEALDALDAVYEALPRSIKPRRKYVTPQEKLRILYDNYSELDGVQAVKNLIYNELMDRVVGTIGNEVRKASINLRPHGRLPIGFQAGPSL